MNQSNILLIESKWKSFLKESTNSDIDLDDLVDDIMNNQRPFAPRKETPTKDRVDKKIAAIKKQSVLNKPHYFNSVLQNNVDHISDKLSQQKVINDLETIYSDDELDNTPLDHRPLGKFLGAGYFSAAFEDSDGHVLKCGGIRDGDSETAFYQNHLKKPTKDFIVYYYKVFPVEDFYIAVTNKFLTFFEYAEFRKGSRENDLAPSIFKNAWPRPIYNISLSLDRIKYELKMDGKEITKFSLYSTLMKQSADHVLRFKKEFLDEFGLSPKDSNKILEQMIQSYITQKNPDLHLNNLGVNITAGMDNPSFFYFDQ